MTSVLVIDADTERRTAIEQQLQDSNQFRAIYSCEGLGEATELVEAHNTQVVLLESSLAESKEQLNEFKSHCPEVGIVVVNEPGQLSDPKWLDSVGAHAETSFAANSMEVMASVAKALVRRLKPKKTPKRGLLRRFFNDK